MLKTNIVRNNEKKLRIRLKIFFYSFNINPFKRSKQKSKKHITKKASQPKKKKTNRLHFVLFILKTSWQILKRTKIKKFHLNIDTGDVIRNAYLIPGFVGINTGNWNFSVNYENKNELIIRIEHRLYIILWQIIVNFINYKFKNR